MLIPTDGGVDGSFMRSAGSRNSFTLFFSPFARATANLTKATTKTKPRMMRPRAAMTNRNVKPSDTIVLTHLASFSSAIVTQFDIALVDLLLPYSPQAMTRNLCRTPGARLNSSTSTVNVSLSTFAT